MKAILYSYTEELGVLDLQLVDQTMGVVGGTLTPSEEYLRLQHAFRQSKGAFTPELEKLK